MSRCSLTLLAAPLVSSPSSKFLYRPWNSSSHTCFILVGYVTVSGFNPGTNDVLAHMLYSFSHYQHDIAAYVRTTNTSTVIIIIVIITTIVIHLAHSRSAKPLLLFYLLFLRIVNAFPHNV
jgi:hypothetical protein